MQSQPSRRELMARTKSEAQLSKPKDFGEFSGAEYGGNAYSDSDNKHKEPFTNVVGHKGECEASCWDEHWLSEGIGWKFTECDASPKSRCDITHLAWVSVSKLNQEGDDPTRYGDLLSISPVSGNTPFSHIPQILGKQK